MHKIHQYAEDVAAGRIVTGLPVRWACKRHLLDLQHGEKRGFYFDDSRAESFLEFARLQKHFKGPWAGQPFDPEPWQEFLLGCIFGWIREDGTRRFREAWINTAKKQGKTFVEAIIALWMLAFDGEQGAEVVSVATKAKQARIAFDAARMMVTGNKDLHEFIRVFKTSLWSPGNDGRFTPLSRSQTGEDGPSISCAILDEIHEWPDGALWRITRSGRIARPQPLLVAATTAGFNMYGFGKQQYDLFRRIVDPNSGTDNDSAFVYIAEIDDGDDWRDESVWIKANPNLGVSVTLDQLREEFATAEHSTADENNFRVKHLNGWVAQAERWLSMAHWDDCVGAF